jgi:polyphosphate kinase
LSANVRVVSIVGRFLEHSRIFWFENGGEAEALIGSADLMGRNLDRRIETLVPVTRPALVQHLYAGILRPYLEDSVNAWEMAPDGSFHRRAARRGRRRSPRRSGCCRTRARQPSDSSSARRRADPCHPFSRAPEVERHEIVR